MSIDTHALVLLVKVATTVASSIKAAKLLEADLLKDLERVSRSAAELEMFSPLFNRQLKKRFYSSLEEKELQSSLRSAEDSAKEAKKVLFDLAIGMGYEEIASSLREALSDEDFRILQNYQLLSKPSTFVSQLKRFSFVLSRRTSKSPNSDSDKLKKVVAELETNVQRFARLLMVLRLYRGGVPTIENLHALEEFVVDAERRLKESNRVSQSLITIDSIKQDYDSCASWSIIKDGYRFGNCILDERVLFQTLRSKQKDDPEEVERQRQRFKEQTEDLVRLFSTPCNEDMRSMLGILQCAGYSALDEDSGHYGLLFRVPENMEVRSLRKVLEGCDVRNPLSKPPLDSRKIVAARIAQAVLLIHKFGLVHKAINIDAVVLLSPKNRNATMDDWGSPYLVSFGITRFDQNDSNRSEEGRSLQYDVYHCPSRAASHRIEKHHFLDDIYSLGVVLLEIGLLQPAVMWSQRSGFDYNSDLLGDDIRGEYPGGNEDCERVFNKLKSLAETLLPREMGLSYAEAVLACLNGWNRWTEMRDPLDYYEDQEQGKDEDVQTHTDVNSKPHKTKKRISGLRSLGKGLSALLPFGQQIVDADQGDEDTQDVEDSVFEALAAALSDDDGQNSSSGDNFGDGEKSKSNRGPSASFEGAQTAIERTTVDPRDDKDSQAVRASTSMTLKHETELWVKLLEEVVDKLDY